MEHNVWLSLRNLPEPMTIFIFSSRGFAGSGPPETPRCKRSSQTQGANQTTMSINLTILQIAPATVDFERAHRLRLRVAYWTASLATFTVFMYGLDYYLSDAKQRALSPKHALLKPG